MVDGVQEQDVSGLIARSLFEIRVISRIETLWPR